jgi:hypothetical protein
LREKLESDPSHPRHLITELAIGYRLQIPDDSAAVPPNRLSQSY